MTTHGGAGRGQGRKPLARRVKGLRVWVPVKDEAEAERITNLSAHERRARLLGEETQPMRTFRYEERDEPRYTDLREAWNEAEGYKRKVYAVYIFDENGKAQAEAAEALLLPDHARVAFAWGADADWMDSTGDIERDIDIFLNDPEEMLVRN